MADHDNRVTGYVIDTSALISIEGRPDQNKILYYLSILIEQGAVKCPPEVWEELLRCHWVLAWIKPSRSKIIENMSQDLGFLSLVGQITFKFHSMSGARGSRNRADPYIVAFAVMKNAASNPVKWAVVAAETLVNRPARKIPTACRDHNIECLGLIDMLAREFPDEEW